MPLRRFEILLFLPWGLATLFFAKDVLGAKLFLVYLYGHSIHFLISFACWYALFLATYPLLRLLLPKAKKADA